MILFFRFTFHFCCFCRFSPPPAVFTKLFPRLCPEFVFEFTIIMLFNWRFTLFWVKCMSEFFLLRLDFTVRCFDALPDCLILVGCVDLFRLCLALFVLALRLTNPLGRFYYTILPDTLGIFRSIACSFLAFKVEADYLFEL